MTDKKAKTGRTKSPAHTGWSGGKGYLRRGTTIGGERLRGERLELKKKDEEKCRRLFIEHMSIVTSFLLVETASFSFV